VQATWGWTQRQIVRQRSAYPKNVDLPVSVKAALRCGERWVLLRNERNEWELPGGRIDPDDQSLPDVVVRECREEIGIEVTVGVLLGSWLFEVVPDKRVVIICFSAEADPESELVISHEHNAVGMFEIDELAELNLPYGYRQAIRQAATQPN